MEVHQHTHTPRKKWQHYFWEFFMLFLAVTAGFFVENLREHKIEKDREKEFMKSMLYDLRRDSSYLAYNMETGPRIIRFSDSLIIELKKRPLQGKEKRLHHFLCLTSEGLGFRYYDRTVSQLRNSGGFRLIKDPAVSDAIMDYDVYMREALHYATTAESLDFIMPQVNKMSSIFDVTLLFDFYNEARKYPDHIDSVNYPAGLKLLTYSEPDIKEYVNLLRMSGTTDIIKLDYSTEAFRKNRELDSLIRKEYYLK